MAVRAQASVKAALAAVVDALQAINASRDTAWLTTPKTCRRAGNAVTDISAPRPAILVRATALDMADTHLAVNRDARLTFKVAGLAQDAPNANEVIWNLEADVRRALLVSELKDEDGDPVFKGGLSWTGSETQDVGGSGGSGEAMTVATFEGLVYWTAENP
jgi:hypothetical protein